MLKRKKTTTITRPDRDRLLAVTRAKAASLPLAIFVDDLRRALDGARVVEAARVPRDVVTMDATVRFVDLRNGHRELYRLVYPDQADLRVGKLPVLSPLGAGLLGARAGDVQRLVVNLIAYVSGDPNYLRMAIFVLMAFYLNQRPVREVFLGPGARRLRI